VARISGKEVVKIFGTRKHCGRDWKTGVSRFPPRETVQPRQPDGETVTAAPPMSTRLRLFGYFLILVVALYFGYCAVMVQRVMH